MIPTTVTTFYHIALDANGEKEHVVVADTAQQAWKTMTRKIVYGQANEEERRLITEEDDKLALEKQTWDQESIDKKKAAYAVGKGKKPKLTKLT